MLDNHFPLTNGKLDVREFGYKLLTTGDLDPVYHVVLHNKALEDKERRAWFYLAYWCFYDIGAAGYIADAANLDGYWTRFMTATENELKTPMGGRWPRASERRHFRGAKAIDAVKRYQATFINPKCLVEDLSVFNYSKGVLPYPTLKRRVTGHPQFGPWMAFKIGDMLERIDGVPVDFSGDDIFMFKDPTEGALKVWEESYKGYEDYKFADKQLRIDTVTYDLVKFFRDLEMKAPPSFDRPVGLQEVETILCKWKSYMKGHYHIGDDIRHNLKTIREWKDYSPIVCGFDQAVPAKWRPQR